MSGATHDAPWTTRRLLAWMSDAFRKRDLDSPRLMAEMLIAHVLQCDRLRLYTDADRPANNGERYVLRDLTRRALNHEPVQYLTGEAWFFGLPMHVDRRVLVPRPSTETIVEFALQHARVTPGFGGASGDGVLAADVCTGSGCIATAMARHLPGARVIASDVSPEALEVARLNRKRHGVEDRVELVEGDLLDPIRAHPAAGAAGTLHYVMSNPPYIPDSEWDDVPPNVKLHEPHLALRGGADGLRLVRPLIEQAPPLLRADGWLLVEVADARADDAAGIAKATPGLTDVRILRDLEGLKRVIAARKE